MESNDNWVTKVATPVASPDASAGNVEDTVVDSANARGMQAIDLPAWYGKHHAIRNVNMTILPNRVTAIIGPSGCGKSTFIRCLNRMHEVIPDARIQGQILLDTEDICAPGVDPVQVRKLI